MPRNRIEEKKDNLLKWAMLACPIHSGKSYRQFRGTSMARYSNYLLYCANESLEPLGMSYYQYLLISIGKKSVDEILAINRIGLKEGDKFEDKQGIVF